MQGALLSVLAHALVVVQAVGQVGILLDFGNQCTCTDRVDRPGLNKEKVPAMHGHIVEQMLYLPVLIQPAYLVTRDVAVEPVDELGATLRCENVPKLGLAERSVLVLARVVIVRVYLY